MTDSQLNHMSSGRSPSVNSNLSRPVWPWASSPSNPLLRYSNSQRSSTSHSYSGSTSTLGSGGTWQPPPSSSPSGSSVLSAPSLSWQNSSGSNGTQRQNSAMAYNTASGHDVNNARQWSFLGFEWVVRDVHKLRNYLESEQVINDTPPTGDDTEGDAGDFDVLRHSPILGDHKFKLEIARSPTESGQPSSGLSLYITSLALDFAHPDYEMSAVMMTAIKCQDERVGERGARPDWVWESWQHDWVFRQESEVWACALPTLTELLENPRIRETDSFVITVQVHSPIGPFFPSHPSAYYVPKDLLDGLEASLDNSNTGGVRFVCLERLSASTQSSSPSEPPSPTTFRSPSSASSQSQTPYSLSHSGHSRTFTTARKRVIYAHSDILIRRSEYFATMLGSGFSENTLATPTGHDRKVYTIVVEEADFETIYWLLKFCYANWLLFKERDDSRAAVDGLGAGWSVKWLLNAPGGEWDWKTFERGGAPPRDDPILGADARSAASGDSVRSRSPRTSIAEGKQPLSPSQARASQASRSPTATRTVPKVSPSTTNPGRPIGSSNSVTSSTRRPSAPLPTVVTTIPSGASKQAPIPLATTSNAPYASRNPGYPLSPRNQRQPSANQIISSPDPHRHPTTAPAPASALSMYHVAHRYAMPGLSALALEHIVNSMTPESSFALLLASAAWDELRMLVEDYIVDKWDEVSVSEEFERCCEEVAAGEWGAEGGKTLMGLFRRLRSPNAMGYVRS